MQREWEAPIASTQTRSHSILHTHTVLSNTEETKPITSAIRRRQHSQSMLVTLLKQYSASRQKEKKGREKRLDKKEDPISPHRRNQQTSILRLVCLLGGAQDQTHCNHEERAEAIAPIQRRRMHRPRPDKRKSSEEDRQNTAHLRLLTVNIYILSPPHSLHFVPLLLRLGCREPIPVFHRLTPRPSPSLSS